MRMLVVMCLIAQLLGGVSAPLRAEPAISISAKTKPKLSLAQLEKLIATIDTVPGFPLVANDKVLRRINGYRTSASKRRDLQASLARMQTYEPMIRSQLKAHNIPQDIIAIPLVESAFKNIAQDKSKLPQGVKPAAGIWMFITSSARTNGLTVKPDKDERLDPEASTKAAMKLLKALHTRFGDWHLAVQAYNQGEVRVDKAIKKAGHRDAWKLVDTKEINDYLVYVTAAAIIVRHPAVLEEVP